MRAKLERSPRDGAESGDRADETETDDKVYSPRRHRTSLVGADPHIAPLREQVERPTFRPSR